MVVIQRVDHGHWAWQRPFDRLTGELTQITRVLHEDRFLALHGAHHGWNTGLIAVTNFHDLAFGKIHPAEMLDEGGDKVLPRLLAVADNIDPGTQLVVERQTQGIALAGQ